MTIAHLSARSVPFGIGLTSVTSTASVLDAAASGGDAVVWAGRIELASGPGTSKTLDTSGSSRIWFYAGSTTFSNAGTTVRVGLADVDATNGPPVRAANTAGAVDFDVFAALVGGTDTITGNAWNNFAPTSGTKTINYNQFVALAIQMVSRGGSDSVQVRSGAPAVSNATLAFHEPAMTSYIDAAYASGGLYPNAVIVFSDGTLGWFYGSELVNFPATRTWNSSSSPSEYGQLYQYPFPVSVTGAYVAVDPDADFSVNLYSDPLGTPVAERTVAVDANQTAAASSRYGRFAFTTAYTVPANTPFAIVLTPGGSNISTSYRTLGHADHRAADFAGTNSYGVSRSGGTGAFANANSSLDAYYVGPMVGGFDDGAGGGGGTVVGSVFKSRVFG